VTEEEALARPFGKESRKRLLDEYFAGVVAVPPADAWKHVYRLLLWTDRTTGLAHCYESDKSQPGRHWYSRSLAFHAWLSRQLEVQPNGVADQIDWLFKRGLQLLTSALVQLRDQRNTIAARQRAPYEGQGFPEPGRDPDLEALIREHLATWLVEPPDDAVEIFAKAIQAYFLQENKRANLVGEGFEDVLAYVVGRLPGAGQLDIRTRPLLHDLPGFRAPPHGEKARRVDLAVAAPGGRRVLVTAKWSIRADREEQFGVDFETYARLEDRREPFEFVLITNEFDGARLDAACQRWAQNRFVFTSVVHANTDALRVVHGDDARGKASLLGGHIEQGRLISLDGWLNSLLSSH
jgi:hypothetical protein